MKIDEKVELICSDTAPIIHVDDDTILLKLVKRFYEKSSLKNTYIPFESGDEFLEFLNELDRQGKELPLIVLIDINMPGMSGFELLEKIRSRENFKILPICSMLSSSKHPDDIKKSLDLGANTYLVKPDNAKEYCEFFDSLMDKISA